MNELVQKAQDKDDHNLPLMVWYAAEPLAALDMKRFMEMAEKSRFPKFLPYTIQRVAALGTEDSKKALKELNNRLGKANTHENHESQMLIGKALEK